MDEKLLNSNDSCHCAFCAPLAGLEVWLKTQTEGQRNVTYSYFCQVSLSIKYLRHLAQVIFEPGAP
jgi:hypothetical protein